MAKSAAALRDITVIVDNNGERRPAKLAAELARVAGAHLTGVAPGPPDAGTAGTGAIGDPLVAAVRLLHSGAGRLVTTADASTSDSTASSGARP